MLSNMSTMYRCNVFITAIISVYCNDDSSVRHEILYNTRFIEFYFFNNRYQQNILACSFTYNFRYAHEPCKRINRFDANIINIGL